MQSFQPAKAIGIIGDAIARLGTLKVVAGVAGLTLVTGAAIAVTGGSGDAPTTTEPPPASAAPLVDGPSCGRTVDALTLEPIGGVAVSIVSATDPGLDRFDPTSIVTTTTAADGSWCLTPVDVTDWSVFVDGSDVGFEAGYPSVWDDERGGPVDTDGWAFVDSWARGYQVGEGSATVDVGELRLDGVAPTCGRVVDSLVLEPLAGVTVTLVPAADATDAPDGRPAAPITGPVRLTTTTGVDGRWCLVAAGIDDWGVFVDGTRAGYERGYLGFFDADGEPGAPPGTDHYEVDSWANGVQLGERNTSAEVGDVHLDPAGPGATCGRTLDSTTLLPILGVAVAAISAPDASAGRTTSPIASTISADDGSWCLDVVTATDWTIFVNGNDAGYEAGYPSLFDADTETFVAGHYEIDTWDRGLQIGEGSEPVDVGDLHLDPLAETCGRVVDSATLQPLDGVSVAAISVADASTGVTAAPITATLTDDRGDWCLVIVTEEDWTIRVDGTAIGYEAGHPSLFDASTGRVEERGFYLVDSWDNGFQVGEGTMGVELGDIRLDPVSPPTTTPSGPSTTSAPVSTTTTVPRPTTTTTTTTTTTSSTTTTTVAPADPRITSLTSGSGNVPLPTECSTKIWITATIADPNGGPMTVKVSWVAANDTGQTTYSNVAIGSTRLGVASFDYRYRGEAITITVLVTDPTGRTDQAQLQLTGDLGGGSCPSNYG